MTEEYQSSQTRFAKIETHLNELGSRFDSVDLSVQQIAQVVTRLEGIYSSEKSQGKTVAGTSANTDQVRSQPLKPSGNDRPLGYRPPMIVMETRDGMLKKIEMPVFDGLHPFSWIARVESFFRVGNFAGDDQLQLVSMSLEGPVLNWYNGEMEEVPFTSWKQFKKRMIHRFSGSLESEPGKRFFGIKQVGSIQDYVNEFEKSWLIWFQMWMRRVKWMCFTMV